MTRQRLRQLGLTAWGLGIVTCFGWAFLHSELALGLGLLCACVGAWVATYYTDWRL